MAQENRVSVAEGIQIVTLAGRPSETLAIPKPEVGASGSGPIMYEVYYTESSGDRPPLLGAGPTVPQAAPVNINYNDRVINLMSTDFITDPKLLDKDGVFSQFIREHQRMASILVEKFLALRTEDLVAGIAFIRDRISSEFFFYALTSALRYRTDTDHLRFPSYAEAFPFKFIPAQAVAFAGRIATQYQPNERPVLVLLPRSTRNDINPERRLDWFREDLGINLHHWQWHSLYPFEGPAQVAGKNRRGELFLYMHHQMMTRYEVERLCHGLPLVVPLTGFDEPLESGYFANINIDTTGQSFASRSSNMRFTSINRPGDSAVVDIGDMRSYKHNILNSIHSRKVTFADGSVTDINNDEGSDIIGNLLEASYLSAHSELYGSYHNSGHFMIALIHDPDNTFKQPLGVMGQTATAMRDPAFFRWHKYIDRFFDQHKELLPRYTHDDLVFHGISITNLKLQDFEGRDNNNTLYTCWSFDNFDLQQGLDYRPAGPTLVKVLHLNHDDFQYKFNVTNTTGQKLFGTVRIFIAPVNGDRGKALDFAAQTRLMIELDKFVVLLQPGVNKIIRRSIDSSVTVSSQTIYRESNSDECADNACTCGWPHYMLLPKGTPEGFPMRLFVMVTDYRLDMVRQESELDANNRGMVFCGKINALYPDKRPMNYPFDRMPQDNITNIQSFLTSNMSTIPITITHIPGIPPLPPNERTVTMQDFIDPRID